MFGAAGRRVAPGARWAREGMPSRGDVEAQIASLPAHAQPPMRELGRRSEAASHPYKVSTPAPRIPGQLPRR